MRRVGLDDADSLLQFYNGLSRRSIRTFHPLGERTTLAACRQIVRENQPDGKSRFDLVALVGRRTVGWSFLCHLDTPRPSFGLGVADEYQGRGLGSQLMDQVLAVAGERGLQEVFLTVCEHSHLARKMYQRRGFVPCGAFVGGDGLSYLTMVLRRPDSTP